MEKPNRALLRPFSFKVQALALDVRRCVSTLERRNEHNQVETIVIQQNLRDSHLNLSSYTQ